MFSYFCTHHHPKAQVSFSDQNLSVLSRCCRHRWRYRKLFIFSSFSPEQLSTKLGTKHCWVKGIQVCSNEGFRRFPRGDNYEI